SSRLERLPMSRGWKAFKNRWLALAVVVAALGLPPGSSARAQFFAPAFWRSMSGTCAYGKQVLSYTGSAQKFVVPFGCSTLIVKAWGGGGAGGTPSGGTA